MKLICLLLVLTLASCSQRFYIVRHAEKAVVRPDTENMFETKNPPLSKAGESRAQLLKQKLSGKKIKYIFSTDYARTLETAKPLADAVGVEVQIYQADQPAEEFVKELHKITKGNVLVVGHSNTVDDIINEFTQQKFLSGDLEDTEYDNLFIIKKRGSKFTFKREKFGDPGGADKQ